MEDAYFPAELAAPQPRPVTTIIERIKYLIYLSRMTQSQFAARIGMNPGNFSKVLTGKMPPSDSLINRIVADLGVSKRWLTTGEDVPYAKPDHAVDLDVEGGVRMSTRRQSRGTLFYDVDVTGGNRPLAETITSLHPAGRIDIPGIDPEGIAVKVTGDSMEPRIHNGSLIVIHPVELDSTIFWGQMYVVELDGARMVKYLKKGSTDSTLTLHSENPAHEDVEINRNDVRHLYVVDRIINIISTK